MLILHGNLRTCCCESLHEFPKNMHRFAAKPGFLFLWLFVDIKGGIRKNLFADISREALWPCNQQSIRRLRKSGCFLWSLYPPRAQTISSWHVFQAGNHRWAAEPNGESEEDGPLWRWVCFSRVLIPFVFWRQGVLLESQIAVELIKRAESVRRFQFQVVWQEESQLWIRIWLN